MSSTAECQTRTINILYSIWNRCRSLTLRHDFRRNRAELVLKLFDHLVNQLVELACHLRTCGLCLMC